MPPDSLPPMTMPGTGSATAFVAIVGAVCVMFVIGVRWSGPVAPAARRRRTLPAVFGIGAVLTVSAAMAELGLTRALAGRPAFALVPLLFTGLAVAAALSPLGRQMADALPAAALVGFQAFRLPLELVLHRWWKEGVLPVQMTYSGHNFDIVTGVLALVVAAGLVWGRLSRVSVWVFNVVGSGLLLTVIAIALMSSPVPIRRYMNEPVIQLAFHAPYIWILSICVAGALFGHLVTFRRLLRLPSGARP